MSTMKFSFQSYCFQNQVVLLFPVALDTRQGNMHCQTSQPDTMSANVIK
jgi:hypothetical protein